MLRPGIALSAGCCCLLFADSLPDADLVALSVPWLPLCVAARRWRPVAAFMLGALLAWFACAERLEDRWPVNRDGEIVEFSACITGMIERDGRRQRFLAEPLARNDLPSRIRLSLYSRHPHLEPGQCWRWKAKLRTPRGFLNPGGFDYERWLFQRGIGATGYLRDTDDMTRLAPRPAVLDRTRQYIAERIAGSADTPAAGLLVALAVGERGGISNEQWKILQETGTAHLVAISGLHVGLVAGLAWWLTGALRRPQRWRLLPGLLVATAYAALAGFSLPVQRALVMLSVIVAYRLLRRRIHWSQALGTALAVILLMDPLAPLDTGFWLSFLAIVAILILAAERRDGRRWLRVLRVQAGLSFLLGPVLLWNFGMLPLASIPANLLAIPLFGFLVVPAVLVGLVLVPFGWSAPWLEMTSTVLVGILDAVAFLGRVMPAVTPYAEPASLLLAAAGLVIAALPLAPALRCFGLAMVVPALLAEPVRPDLKVVFLDVGQGQAVSVETRNHTLIYDTGPGFGESSAADWVVIPYLRFVGRVPDYLVASHGDNDHAGGFERLRDVFPEAVAAGRTRGDGHAQCKRGDEWQWDGWTFRFVHPPAAATGSDNNASCVLRISRSEHAVLLTGDIEAGGERILLASGENLRAELVSMPHHGSRSSSTVGFVAAVNARHAVASAGFGNRWGFPRPEVRHAWQAAGAAVAVTGDGGAVSYTLDQDGWHASRYRDKAAAIWRSPVR